MGNSIFIGWPHLILTKWEAEAIDSTFHELRLHEPNLSEDRCWYLAGQIIARVKRDVPIYSKGE